MLDGELGWSSPPQALVGEVVYGERDADPKVSCEQQVSAQLSMRYRFKGHSVGQDVVDTNTACLL